MNTRRWAKAGLAAVALLGCAVPFAAAQEKASITAPSAPPAAVFRLNTTVEAAGAAFSSGYESLLDLDFARTVAEFGRAFQLDQRLALARAYELTMRGPRSALADSIEQLHLRNGTANLIENLLFLSMRERHAGQAARANALLNAAARSAYADARVLAEYHLWLGYGTAARVAIARSLRDADPGSHRAQAYVAMALSAPADTAEALTAMREALRLAPTRPLAHYAAGELLLRLSRFEDAAAHYSHALQREPNYYLAQLGRGDVALLANRPADARRDYEAVTRSAVYAPTMGVARRALAISHLYERNLERGIQEMTAAAQQFEQQGLRGQTALAHRHLAVMAALKKDLPLVERSIAAEKRLQGDEAGLTVYWAAISWSAAGQPQRARQELTQLERLVASGEYVPGAGSMEAVRSMVLSAEGKFAEALTAAGTSGNHWALIASYQALTGLGRTAEAREPLQRLLNATNYARDAMGKPAAIFLYAK